MINGHKRRLVALVHASMSLYCLWNQPGLFDFDQGPREVGRDGGSALTTRCPAGGIISRRVRRGHSSPPQGANLSRTSWRGGVRGPPILRSPLPHFHRRPFLPRSRGGLRGVIRRSPPDCRPQRRHLCPHFLTGTATLKRWVGGGYVQ